jgi:UPF0755 protein
MIDDLDLAWEEHEPRRRGGPPSRQQRQRRRKDRKRRRRSFGALFVSLVLLAALGFGVYWGLGKLGDVFGADDYTAVGTTPVTIQVHQGDSSTDIAQTLFDKGVVKSTKAFINAAKAEPKSKNIQYGYYKLFLQMPAATALQYLLQPDKYMVTNKVLIPEGMITLDIYSKLSKASGIPVADFVKAGQDPVGLGVPADWFKRTDGKKAPTSIEGFLFPDTYTFDPGLSAHDMLHTMVARFLDVATQIDFVNTVNNNLGGVSPYEALVAASIAQVEGVTVDDFGKISRTLYNRAYGTFDCNCLGLDSEVNYWLRISGKEAQPSDKLTMAQLHDASDPYNTHDKPGLPIGPISNPGKDALQGAMSPPAGKWTYFLTIDKQGHMGFATTLSGFNALKSQACKNGIPIC